MLRTNGNAFRIAFPVIILAASAASAQQQIAAAPSRALIEHRDGNIVHVTANSSFEYVHLFKSATQKYDDLLLQVSQRNEINFELEGTKGLIAVRAWRMRGEKRREPLWALVSVGNEGVALPALGLYRATSWPCCSAMWVNEYFSLTKGVHLYTTNGGALQNTGVHDDTLLSITGHAHNDTRFLGFGASYVKGHERPTLQYGTDSAIKQRIEVRGHEYGDNFDVPTMLLVDDHGLKVTDLDGALNFIIVLRFSEADDQPAAELRIPVVNDVILPKKAVVPNGYSLVELRP
ncbi:MAG TPA: hypothetical protein VIM60_09335 [Edaphobacter sp.]